MTLPAQTVSPVSPVSPADAGPDLALVTPQFTPPLTPPLTLQRPAPARSRLGRKILRTVVSAALIVATFGFALPHLASYRSVWATIEAMSGGQVLMLAAAAAVSLVTGWIAICAVLPAVRLREAAAVNLASTAVANALPAGGALAVGVSWVMMSSWGVSAADYALYTVVSGLWNVCARLSLPAVAVLVLLTDRPPDAGLVAGAVVALGVLAAAAGALLLVLRSEALARRAGRGLERVVSVSCRLARRPAPAQVAGSLLSFRDRATTLVKARGWRITAATAASQLALWLVLLACLRGSGLGQAQVSWQASLAAFAFVRLLTVLPITPGGLGVAELGLVGILAAGASHRVTVQVIAAVLVFRALTYLLPIPLGAAAALAWRHAPILIGGKHRARGQTPSEP